MPLIILFRVLLAAYTAICIFSAFSDGRLWGVHHLQALPAPVSLILGSAAVVLIIPVHRLTQVLTRAADYVGNRVFKYPTVVVVSLASGGLMFLARCRNHLLGDSFEVIHYVANSAIQRPFEPLDVAAHRVFSMFVRDPTLTYVLPSVLSGIIFLLLVGRYVRDLETAGSGRVTLFLVFAGLASVQLFFGYAESYTLANLMVALYVFLAIRFLQTGKRFWWAIIAFTLSGLFHMTCWVLFPSMLLLSYMKFSRDHRFSTIAAPVISVVAAGWSVYNVVSLYAVGDKFDYGGVLVRFTVADTNPYTLLSTWHLFDLANLLLMIAPLPVLIIVIWLIDFRARRLLRDMSLAFLALSFVCTFAFTLFFDPKLGAPRDWDLMSLFGIPAAFLATYIMSSTIAYRKFIRTGTLLAAALVVLCVHTVPWLVSNTTVHASKRLLTSAIAHDGHYTAEYYSGERLKSWAYFMSEEPYCDYQEAVRCQKLILAADPDNLLYRSLCAKNLYFGGEFDEARAILSGIRTFYKGRELTFDVMRLYIRLGMLEEFRTFARNVAAASPGDELARFYAEVAELSADDPEAVIELYNSVMDHPPREVWLISDVAAYAICIGKYDVASAYLELGESLPDLTTPEKADLSSLKMLMNGQVTKTDQSD